LLTLTGLILTFKPVSFTRELGRDYTGLRAVELFTATLSD